MAEARRQDEAALRDRDEGPECVRLRGPLGAVEQQSDRRDGPVMLDHHDDTQRGVRAATRPHARDSAVGELREVARREYYGAVPTAGDAQTIPCGGDGGVPGER